MALHCSRPRSSPVNFTEFPRVLVPVNTAARSRCSPCWAACSRAYSERGASALQARRVPAFCFHGFPATGMPLLESSPACRGAPRRPRKTNTPPSRADNEEHPMKHETNHIRAPRRRAPRRYPLRARLLARICPSRTRACRAAPEYPRASQRTPRPLRVPLTTVWRARLAVPSGARPRRRI
jgi:hypothetical protein